MQIYTFFHYRGANYEKSIYISTEHFILPLFLFTSYHLFTLQNIQTPFEPLDPLMDQSMLCLLNAYGMPLFELTSSYCRAETDFWRCSILLWLRFLRKGMAFRIRWVAGTSFHKRRRSRWKSMICTSIVSGTSRRKRQTMFRRWTHDTTCFYAIPWPTL